MGCLRAEASLEKDQYLYEQLKIDQKILLCENGRGKKYGTKKYKYRVFFSRHVENMWCNVGYIGIV